VDVAQARELLEIQKKTGRYAMVGFNRRFATAYLMAREIIERQEFGRTAMYLAKYNSSEYKSDEYFVQNHLIHHLDIARFFLGEIKELQVAKIKLSDKKVGYHLMFTARSGAIGMIQSGSLQQEPFPMERIEITGDGRNVIIDNVKRLEYNRPGGNKETVSGIRLEDGQDALVWNLNHGQSSGYGHIGYERELAYFIDCVQNQKIPEPNFEDILHTMEFCDRIKKMGGAL
jgi:predicted dehydrogenase